MTLRRLICSAVVASMLLQSHAVRAENGTAHWALLYRLCTDNWHTLRQISDMLQAVGWHRENWPEHALETARQGALVSFFPETVIRMEQVNDLIKGLDQLRDPAAMPSYGFALSHTLSGDRSYFYIKDGKRLCSFVSVNRLIDLISAEIGQAAPNVSGFKRSGIHRTDGFYVLLREVTPNADALMPPEFPSRTQFFVSLDVQQPENSP